MAGLTLRRTIIMPKNQASGQYIIQNARGYKYLSFINNTPAVIEAYQDVLSHRDDGSRYIYRCPSFGQYSIPIEERPDFTFFWECSSAVDESFQVILTTENPNFNSTFLAPSQAGSVKLVQDDVGLARSKQLPSALSPTGNLKVDVQNEVNIKSDPNNPVYVKVDGSTGGGGTPTPTQKPKSYAQSTATVGTASTNLVTPYGTEFPYGVMIMAHPDNTGLVYVGNMSGQYLPLVAGAAIQIELDKTSSGIYAKGSINNQQVITMWGVN